MLSFARDVLSVSIADTKVLSSQLDAAWIRGQAGWGSHDLEVVEMSLIPQGTHCLWLSAQVPEGVSDDVALLLGDILSTAFFCAEQGGVQPGQTVAVVGCGPVGLLAVLAAQHLGAGKVTL